MNQIKTGDSDEGLHIKLSAISYFSFHVPRACANGQGNEITAEHFSYILEHYSNETQTQLLPKSIFPSGRETHLLLHKKTDSIDQMQRPVWSLKGYSTHLH